VFTLLKQFVMNARQRYDRKGSGGEGGEASSRSSLAFPCGANRASSKTDRDTFVAFASVPLITNAEQRVAEEFATVVRSRETHGSALIIPVK